MVAPGERPQACVELIGVERLHDVVVGADQQARNSIERLDACAGNKHDSHVVAVTLSERATHLVAGDFLEGDLEHDQRRRKSVRKLHRLDAGRRLVWHEAEALDESGNTGATSGIAVGDESRSAAARKSPHGLSVRARR